VYRINWIPFALPMDGLDLGDIGQEVQQEFIIQRSFHDHIVNCRSSDYQEKVVIPLDRQEPPVH
jgi:hypothetical protein